MEALWTFFLPKFDVVRQLLDAGALGQAAVILCDAAGNLAVLHTAEAARRIAEGRLESPVRPLTESIATLQVMDEIRRQVGVAVPGER